MTHLSKKKQLRFIQDAIQFVQQGDVLNMTNETIAQQLNISTEQWLSAFKQWSGIQTSNPIPFLQMKHIPKILSKDQPSLWIKQAKHFPTKHLMVKQKGPIHLFKEMLHYDVYDCFIGPTIIASDSKGICLIEFIQSNRSVEKIMQSRYKGLEWKKRKIPIHQLALEALEGNAISPLPISLYGTSFQLHVWNELIHLPENDLTTYKALAEALGDHKKSRAVGQAIGKNPIAYLIPCHRVVNSNGHCGHYLWGENLKKALLLHNITFY